MGRASAEQGLRNTCVGCGAAVIFTSVRGSSAIERLLHTSTVGRFAPLASRAITGPSGPGGRWHPGERVRSTACASPWKRGASRTRSRPWSAGVVVRGHGEPHRLGGRRRVAHGWGGDQLPLRKSALWPDATAGPRPACPSSACRDRAGAGRAATPICPRGAGRTSKTDRS
mgnify:CR=1 FL=1